MMDYRIVKGVAQKRRGKKLVNVCMVSYEKDSEVFSTNDLAFSLMMACAVSGYDLLKKGLCSDYITKEEYEERAAKKSLVWIDTHNANSD